MRKIKFRAWNGKQMVLHDSLYEFQRQNLTISEFDNVEYLQYTGLKDKNGKEIYEGDIIKNKYGFTSQVNWFGLTAGFAPFGGGIGEWVASECEIIGNIYENPELLK